MINEIKFILDPHSDPADANYMKKYMKDRYAFLGIRSPERKELLKDIIREHGLIKRDQLTSTIKGLWKLPEREYQYVAMELFRRSARKFEKADLALIEYTVLNKSWWDTVDFIASNLAGIYFKQYPEQLPSTHKKWMTSGNMWLKRTCLLFQLKYKKETDVDLLFRTIDPLKADHDFFIRKAIGWSLRELGKTNPQVVRNYVKNNKLSALSTKEALKIIG